MRVIAESSEDEMIARFLLGELTSESFGAGVSEALEAAGRSERVLTEPDLTDDDANRARREVPGPGSPDRVPAAACGRLGGAAPGARPRGCGRSAAAEGTGAVGVELGVAVLTMGTRPRELAALLASVAAQTHPPAKVVVVGNGCAPSDLPDGVEGVALPENRGVTGGRNAALERLRDVDVVIDLDDDGLLVADDVFAGVAALYADDPRLGVVSFRIADETGCTQRRHVPRLRAGDPMRGGDVTAFLGGGHALSTAMLARIGDWPEAFFFAHEETDLAWRALDDGWRVTYAPRLLLQHPRTSPTRHAFFHRVNARNRVYLARRHLPASLVPVYLGVWVALTLARTRSAAGLRAWFAGFAEGWRTPCGRRRPMRWRTVWTMTRLGRPPII